MIKKSLLLFGFILLILSCKGEPEKQKKSNDSLGDSGLEVGYAKGFSVKKIDGAILIEVTNPWPNADKSFKYLILPKNSNTNTFSENDFDAIISTPIKSLVATSTTHIPALEALGGLDLLKGFPDTKYISSMAARELIAKGRIKEIGHNEQMNAEITIALNPDVIVGFGINNENSPYELLKKANIPVLFNGDWVEQSPLGKAEWIKFFGVLLGKEKEADSIFNQIESSYKDAKALAQKAKRKPAVLSGALYKDVWYMPTGKSWAATFLEDANANYLYADSEGTGSLSLSIESVLQIADQAEFWVSPSQFTSYEGMEKSNLHYTQFKAFKNKKIYTFANTVGPTGGLLYYELGPQRPDLVLKDLVHILHPELLPDYSPYFFTPLQ